MQRLYDSDSSLGTDWAAAAAEDDDATAAAAAAPAADTGDEQHAAEVPGSTSVSRRQQHRLLLQETAPHHHQQQQQDISKHRSKSHHRSAFCELQYNVYSLEDYNFVWDNYAYLHPVWVGDFGKWNMSATVNMSREARVRLILVDRSSDEPECGACMVLWAAAVALQEQQLLAMVSVVTSGIVFLATSLKAQLLLCS